MNSPQLRFDSAVADRGQPPPHGCRPESSIWIHELPSFATKIDQQRGAKKTSRTMPVQPDPSQD